MFVEAGMTPMQAIQSATINVAKAFRKDKDFGTLEPGKIADIIAVDGDPLKDIWAVQNVKLVVLGGKIVDHEFHANYKNPIAAVRPWRATPQEIEISPRSLAQGVRACDHQSDHAKRFRPFSPRHVERQRTGNPIRRPW